MPAPPSYIDIVSPSPFAQTITIAQFNAGTYGGTANTTWFRYISHSPEAFVLSVTNDHVHVPGTPVLALFESDGSTLVVGGMLAVGSTYYIRMTELLGGVTASDFFATAYFESDEPGTPPSGSVVVPSSYYDITSTPVAVTIPKASFNAGSYGGVAQATWFRYVATSDLVFGAFTDKGGSFAPRMLFYAYDSGAMTQLQNVATIGEAHGFWQPLTAGETYYLEVTNSLGGASTFDFTTSINAAAILTSVPSGAIVINDDTDGFAATAFSPSGTFLGFLPGVPGGETGQALPSGISVFYSAATPSTPLMLFTANFQHIASVDASPTIGGDEPAFTHDATQFWVLDRNRNPSPIYTVSAAGVVSGQLASLVPTTKVSAIGLSTTGSVMYWAEGDTANGTSIHRHDMSLDTPISDLYDFTGLTGSIAQTGVNDQPGDIVVLSDGSIVTWYRDDGAGNKDVIVHISSAGALLHSYDYTHPIRVNHLANSTDNLSSVRVWFYLDAGAKSGRVENLTIATGVATDTFDTPLFSSGVNLVDGNTQLFGPSSSCLMITNYNSTPQVPGTFPDCCDTPTGPGDTGVNPDPIGPLPPWMANCVDGGVVDSVADLADGEVW